MKKSVMKTVIEDIILLNKQNKEENVTLFKEILYQIEINVVMEREIVNQKIVYMKKNVITIV